MKIIDPIPKADINMFDKNDFLVLISHLGTPCFEYLGTTGTWYLTIYEGKVIGHFENK